ncbi:reverse transcriptase [Yersinia kristensenii]|nr:reverse transcriptase [Yersinia kristensenii]MBW5828780.1 reverse transcriptase [Yersinia kristensenii]
MQSKLATWGATDPFRRIERLLRLITLSEWLAEAARITLSSKGAGTVLNPEWLKSAFA